ncbi:MAG: redoxin domain-containing protein [Flavobacteriales bacterium]|nr:redoxin domain-containing protein [Flavobacteriales bacterium]MCW8912269.1 redoxin domain-containing protein [Flavobacteriales bacterium]MCW8937492.1 redoxin domain-containing protein [Flavobacteriales bacterium]MCW8940781.1 redoxin domain-containing protein [Flavobacteriales bacterium]MCW8967183.1 redoxin domain-containing protein [Flavobacteriales bacterium]
MKKLFPILFLLSLSVSIFAQNNKYSIKLKVEGLKNTDLFLINYYGNQRYYKDTAKVNDKGIAHFTGVNNIEYGIYGVFHNGRILFEILVNEPIIEIETDTLNPVKNMVVKKSEENKLFLEHLLHVGKIQENATKLREKHKQETTSTEEKKEIEKQLADIEKEVQDYRLSIIKKHPATFVAALFKAMKEPETTEFDTIQNDSILQYTRYQYYKKHFFDDIDFSDERLIRSPLYHNKIEKYFTKLAYPNPDSINADIDWVVEKARANKEIFKYTIHYLINHYEKSKIMGMDAVFAHIALNYYTKEQAFWADEKLIEKVQDKARKLVPVLIGKTAINLMLLDTAKQNWVNMHKIDKDYTILIFWDPECGHCKKELPKIAEYYQYIKDKSVAVYAVSSDHNEAWKKFIRENNMDFYNVAVPKDVYEDKQKATEYVAKGYTDLKSLNYSTTYDVFTTPQIYLLNKDKIIIAKKLDSELLKQVLNKELGITEELKPTE